MEKKVFQLSLLSKGPLADRSSRKYFIGKLNLGWGKKGDILFVLLMCQHEKWKFLSRIMSTSITFIHDLVDWFPRRMPLIKLEILKNF